MDSDLDSRLISIYDKNRLRESEEINGFWDRLPHEVTFNGKNVLDFGSGLGTMAFSLVEKGAKSVDGIEIESNYKKYSELLLSNKGPEIKKKVNFFSGELSELNDNHYDLIISKDVFEHVIGLDSVFNQLVKKLKPGGELVLGFGPLWFSPFGDHGISKKITGIKFPWLHLLIGKKSLIKFLNDESINAGGSGVSSLQDAGFNELLPEDYESIIKSNNSLLIESWRNNVTSSLMGRVINILVNLFISIGLEKYFIRTMYIVAKKNNN